MITVDWPNKVIFIPKAFCEISQTTPIEIRNLDLNLFRLELLKLESSPEGMPYPRTNKHNTEVLLGGITYARIIEMINDYTITFEDGSYAVNLLGANSNVGDVINLNQVSVRSANSAGLTFNDKINEQSFSNGNIYLNTSLGNPGTNFPKGTPTDPVNNWDDAFKIATNIKLSGYHLQGTLVFDPSILTVNSDFTGVSPIKSLINFTGQNIQSSTFKRIQIIGSISGRASYDGCGLSSPTTPLVGFSGLGYDCGFAGDITIDPANTENVIFKDCFSSTSGTILPCININNTTGDIHLRNYAGGIKLKNVTAGNDVSIDISAGTVKLDASCTSGTIVIRGICELFDESGPGCTVIMSGTMQELIHQTLFATDNIHINVDTGSPGTLYPKGTANKPVNNYINAHQIAIDHNYFSYHLTGHLSFDMNDSLANSKWYGNNVKQSGLILSGQNTTNLYTENIKITGTCNGAFAAFECELDNVDDFTGTAIECSLKSNIHLASGEETIIFRGCVALNTGENKTMIDYNNAFSDVIMSEVSGNIGIKNFNNDTSSITVDMLSGEFFIDSTCLDGLIVVRGASRVIDNSGPNCRVIVTEIEGEIYGLTSVQATKLDELWKLQGLSKNMPMVVTQTSRSVDDISLEISGDGKDITIVERQ